MNKKEQVNVIASDEIGKGWALGPIFVCAYYIDENNYEDLKFLLGKDSKTFDLNDLSSEKKKLVLKQNFSLSIITNERYNKMIEKINLNEVLTLLHSKAINKLALKIENKHSKKIIDAFASEKNFNLYTDKLEITNDFTLVEKADHKYLACSIASLVCKYYFEKEWERLSIEIGKVLPKGASSIVDEFIAKNTNIDFSKIGKLNFKNFKAK